LGTVVGSIVAGIRGKKFGAANFFLAFFFCFSRPFFFFFLLFFFFFFPPFTSPGRSGKRRRRRGIVSIKVVVFASSHFFFLSPPLLFFSSFLFILLPYLPPVGWLAKKKRWKGERGIPFFPLFVILSFPFFLFLFLLCLSPPPLFLEYPSEYSNKIQESTKFFPHYRFCFSRSPSPFFSFFSLYFALPILSLKKAEEKEQGNE